jgi:hypothetical protein
MACEELILSVVIILILMLLIACLSSWFSQKDYFDDAAILDKKQPKLEWGGVPIQINSVMSHGNLGMEQGKLPVTNSYSAIQRLQAETVTPPWSDEGYGQESNNTDGESYVTQYLSKRKNERNSFKAPGAYKNTTGVRYMSGGL